MLENQDHICFFRSDVELCNNDTTAGLILSQIKLLPSTATRHNRQWLAITLNDWSDHTTLTYRQVQCAIGRLVEMNLIEKFNGRLDGIKTMHVRVLQDGERPVINPSLKKVGHIYLVQAHLPDSPCKIGQSKSIPDRLKLFAVKLPFTFDLLRTFPADNRHAAERALHKQYADKRGNGEWFNLSPADIEAIKTITAYQNITFTLEPPQ